MEALQQALDRSGVPVRTVRAGDRLATGPRTQVEVYHPPARGMLGSDNANSLVLLVEHEGRRILLPGDIESPGIEAILAEEPIDCDVLMAPHHGSLRSNSPDLAQWCTPQWVVVSGGRASLRPETTATYRAAGAVVIHTADVGAVQVEMDGDGLSVDGFRASSRR